MKTSIKSKKLKIWLLQDGEPLPVFSDNTSFRTARLSKELASRGHDVTYWCSSMQHHKKTVYCEENKNVIVDNYTLSILHAGKYESNHSVSRYLHHRKLAQLFSKEARNREVPDIIIAGFPIHYCAYEAVKFANENKIPVVVDIRDYWPDIFLTLFPKKLQGLGRFIFKNDFEIARKALQNATVLVSMMSHLLEWGAKRYAKRNLNTEDRVFFIGGDDFGNGCCEKSDQLFQEIEGGIQGRFVVNYTGSFSRSNHPLAMIEAAKHLNSMGHKERVLFLLAGHGDYYQHCVKTAQGLDNVVFLGWLSADRIAALNSISSVGIFPSVQEFSFPNKAFSYLGAGLPILSSEHGDLNCLLEKYNAGFHFDLNDPIQLANKILDLSRLDHETYNKISENAKSLFQDHLRAAKIYREYADHVEYIANKYSCTKRE